MHILTGPQQPLRHVRARMFAETMDALRQSHPHAHLEIATFLSLINGDAAWNGILFDHGYGERKDPSETQVAVQKLIKLERLTDKRHIWRLKLNSLEEPAREADRRLAQERGYEDGSAGLPDVERSERFRLIYGDFRKAGRVLLLRVERRRDGYETDRGLDSETVAVYDRFRENGHRDGG